MSTGSDEMDKMSYKDNLKSQPSRLPQTVATPLATATPEGFNVTIITKSDSCEIVMLLCRVVLDIKARSKTLATSPTSLITKM